MKVDGSDKDLTGKVLHSKVDEIDLNGQAATLDASHLGKTLATGGGTNYTIKDTSSEVAGLAKALVKGKAINITNATNTADLKTIGTTNESGAITYTKLTDSATAIAGTLGNIKNGVTVTLNTAATGQELSDISTKATGVTATLVAANVTDTAAELKKFKDLLKGKTVKLKDGETASAGVYDEISTEAVKKVGGIAGTFTGNVEDTVANLVKAKVLTLTGVGTVTAKLKSDGSDKDLTATDLHSKVTVIDLNSQAAVLDADDLSKTITGTTYTVKDTAEKIANLASSKFKGKTVQVTDRGKLSHIKTITDDAGSVTYKVKDTTTALVGANKALIQGIDVEISSATVSAANYNAILVEATKKAGGKVVGTVSDDISRIVAENKYSFTGNLDVIAKVESDNQDISALSLDTEIKKIDLNGKKGVIFSIENVRTGGVNKTIQDTPTGGSYKYKDTGSELSKDVNTIALIKNQTVEISDKVDMDTLKSISDSATAAKTTATLIEDTSAKLKDNKTLIAGTSGEKTVTLTTNSTSSVYDEILTEIKKTGGSASLKGAVVDSVDGLKVDRDLSGATSVIVEVTNATKDLTGITFDSEVTRVNLKDTKEVKFSMAHLKGQALNFIYDSGGQGNHLIEDSYADIVENSSTIAHARKLLRTKSLVVTDEIDTTKLADLKSKITTTTTIFDIKKIKDTAKNLIDNKDDITADAEITIDDASTIADTSQINALQLVSATVNYNKVHDSITLLKANKADLDKKAVTFSDSTSNATDYDALVTAVGTGKVIGAVIDTPTNLKDGKDLSNATSVTVRLTDTDNDLSGITLDSEVTAIDLNGQTGTFGIADIDNKSITSGTYIIKDTAAEILKAGDVDGSNAAKDVSKFKALWGASKIIVTGWTNEDLSKIGINTAETKAAATAASVNLGTTTIQLDVADTEAAQEITKAEAAKLATIDSINILGGKKITISNEAFKAGAIALNELDTITAGATGSEFIIKADTETNVDLGKISTIGTNISKITINGTTNADVIQLSKAFIGHKDATIDLSSGDGKADKVIFNVDKSQFSSTGSDTLNYINVTNFESSKDRVGLYYGGYSDSPKSAIKTLTSTAATTSGAANFNKDITYIEEDTTITSGTIADVDKVSEVKSVIADAVGNFNKPGVGEERRLFLSNYITNPEDFKTNAVLYSADMGGITEAKSDLAATDSFKVIGIASLVDVSEKSLGTLPMGNLANKPSDFV